MDDEQIHCRYCGKGIELVDGEDWRHVDGYTECPPAWTQTFAEPEAE